MAKCDFCGKETEVMECKIQDKMGVRFRNLCADCISSLHSQAQVEILSSPKTKEKKVERISDIDNIMMTTGPSFEGYKIKEYKGIVFDETITGIGLKTTLKGLGDMFASLTGDQMTALTDRINHLKTVLISRLKEKALDQGANAIIGIDIESTIPSGDAIMVSANGTAVIIEKIDE